jgi:hypothetical protein
VVNNSLDVVDSVALHSLLPAILNCVAGKYSFWAQDTKQEFYRNANRLMTNWLYDVEEVTYTINSRGYRAQELGNIDWANSIVLLGCSFVFGEGVDDQDTIASQLSTITKLPVVNLGVCGSGLQWQLHNMTLLRRHFPAPKAVICLWPDAGRDLYYISPYEVFNGGPWNMTQGNSTDHWNKGANPGTQLWMAHQQAQYMWKDVSPYIAAAWQAEVSETLGVYRMDTIWQELPKGRDLRHPGRQANYLAAEQLRSLLKDNNVIPR